MLKTERIIGTIGRFLLGNFLPRCYCRSCGQCTSKARFRFYRRFLNSCEACLTCPNSGALWQDEPEWRGGSPSSEHLTMDRWYYFRAYVSSLLGLVAAKLYPHDPPQNTPAQQEGVAKEC